MTNSKQTTPEEAVVSKLIEKGWHISCAESCTGGMVASMLVNVANASRVLDVSFVTYAESAKMKYVHVSETTLTTHGVVSEAVAAEMAQGVAKEAGSQVGIGITGLAGPGGGSKELPVGTVCFGFFVDGAMHTKTMHFPDLTRNEVRQKSAVFALNTLLFLLNK